MDIHIHTSREKIRAEASLAHGVTWLDLKIGSGTITLYAEDKHTDRFAKVAALLNEAFAADQTKPHAMPAGYAEDAGSGP